ncbi:MAG: glycosyltransferase family 2 protein [Novosphingobium sp.]
MAPLLAVSPLAYRLWLRDEQPVPWGTEAERLPLVALIDTSSGEAGLNDTLRSLESEQIMALAVGTAAIPTLADVACHIDWTEETWLMPLAAGDVLAPGAARTYRDAAARSGASLVYADDDLLGRGARHTPHFKPAWNGELFRHFDYLTGGCILRASAQDLDGLSGPAWAVHLVARAAATAANQPAPFHVCHVLHHRRSRPRPRIPAPLNIQVAELPLVSVIVPTRNRLDLLRTTLDGLAATDYPKIEVLVVDNGSDDPATLAYLDGLDAPRHRVLRQPGPFNFSALNNRAAAEARGRLLCLLNNDIEVIEPGWLKAMVWQALREDVGAVGAQLLYPDGRIQHAGVVLGVGGGAAHAHRLLRPDEEGYFYRHALPQFVTAVTAACLVVQRERFEAVDGLDEQNFAVAFNDVDLCMRLNRRGWQSLYEPRATLVHHESVSRGSDRDPVGAARLSGELAALQGLWGTGEVVDPFHHPQLSRFSERFVVNLQDAGHDRLSR